MTLRLPAPAGSGLCCLLALLVGCAPSAPLQMSHAMVESGFLTDYSLLAPSGDDHGELIYRRPNIDFSRFQKVKFERVHLWRARNDGFGDIHDDQLQRLADDLYFAVRTRLESTYELVDEPQENTIEIHLALTDVDDANATVEVFATKPPSAQTLSERSELGSALLAFVASALVELEIDDTASHEVLVASIELGIGRQTSKGALTSDADVAEAFAEWAERIAGRLTDGRTGKHQR